MIQLNHERYSYHLVPKIWNILNERTEAQIFMNELRFKTFKAILSMSVLIYMSDWMVRTITLERIDQLISNFTPYKNLMFIEYRIISRIDLMLIIL